MIRFKLMCARLLSLLISFFKPLTESDLDRWLKVRFALVRNECSCNISDRFRHLHDALTPELAVLLCHLKAGVKSCTQHGPYNHLLKLIQSIPKYSIFTHSINCFNLFELHNPENIWNVFLIDCIFDTQKKCIKLFCTYCTLRLSECKLHCILVH